MNGTIRKPGIIACCVLIGLWILILVVVPEFSRWVRGVDKEGLPRELVEMDPTTSPWFSVDDKPLLYWSRERDGTMRFWNRPGVTPDTRQTLLPVSRTQRIEWENRRGEGLYAVPVVAPRRESGQWVAWAPNEQNEVDVARAAMNPAPVREVMPDRRPAGGANQRMNSAPVREVMRLPSPTQSQPQPARTAARSWGSWRQRTLHPGLFVIVDESGSRWVEVESGGGGEFQAEGAGRVPFGPGTHQFQTRNGNFRIHCGESRPFVIRYRVAGD